MSDRKNDDACGEDFDIDQLPKQINKLIHQKSSQQPFSASVGAMNSSTPTSNVNANQNFRWPVNLSNPWPYQSNPNFMMNNYPYFNQNHQYYQPVYTNQNVRRWNSNNNFTPIDQAFVSKLAEDKMSSTFKSIEMILETFHSINSILDSTYSAILNSFRTIAGVTDQLIMVHNQLIELALIPRLIRMVLNFLIWFFKFFGLGTTNLVKFMDRKINENIWNTIVERSNKSTDFFDSTSKSSNEEHFSLWPIMLFFSLIFGTPYVAWRLLNGTNSSSLEQSIPTWASKRERNFKAIALKNHQSRGPNEIGFRKGQILLIKPDSLRPDSTTVVVCTIDRQPQIGLVPLNLIKIIANT
ncbi:heat shock protein 90 [Sarcoptes scabiei]|nr:heat shock protein 90 [Sarcoptes scabiei]